MNEQDFEHMVDFLNEAVDIAAELKAKTGEYSAAEPYRSVFRAVTVTTASVLMTLRPSSPFG